MVAGFSSTSVKLDKSSAGVAVSVAGDLIEEVGFHVSDELS